MMGQLPAACVVPMFANDKFSVDYAGPLTPKVGSSQRLTYIKAYVTIFVCLCTECCHIKLVSDHTTDAFLATLYRFVSRRGKPCQLWSDKDLKELSVFSHSKPLKDYVVNFCSSQVIEWKFNHPGGPHHSSVRENSIKASP